MVSQQKLGTFLLSKVFPTQPEQKSAEGRFLEGKLLCEKSHAKISGKKGRRLTEGFSI